jgi:broad specificity phosphatase PhoE
MTLNIYFLRHGQTASSRGNLFCGSIDPSLTADGEAMAQLFAVAYANKPWEAIYCSPKKRALLTVKPWQQFGSCYVACSVSMQGDFGIDWECLSVV